MNGAMWRDAIAWALLHAMWQGALVAGIAGIALALLPRRAVTVRYALALGGLTLLFLLPFATAMALHAVWAVPPASGLAADAAPSPAAPLPWWPALQRAAQPWLGVVLAAWTLGVAAAALRLHRGHRRVRRLAAAAAMPTAALAERFERMRDRLRMRRDITVRTHPTIGVPMLLRARGLVVLLPPALERALDDAALDAVLAHELVHARRSDDRANLWQCVVEAVCFHVPGVCALSRLARAERECCCDRGTVRSGVEPGRYARALALLAGAHARRPRPVVALTDGTLLDRVSRLLAAPEPPRRQAVLAALPHLALPLPMIVVVALAGWAPRPTFGGPITIAASDPAGPFTIRLQRGVVQAATIDGVPVPRSQLQQRGDSLRVLGPRGAILLALAIDARGAIRWDPRPPRASAD